MPFQSSRPERWTYQNHPESGGPRLPEVPDIDAIPKRMKGYRSTVQQPSRVVAKSYGKKGKS